MTKFGTSHSGKVNESYGSNYYARMKQAASLVTRVCPGCCLSVGLSWLRYLNDGVKRDVSDFRSNVSLSQASVKAAKALHVEPWSVPNKGARSHQLTIDFDLA